MAKWNDRDEPIAFLITFRTYGTWCQGDERGSIDKYHNKYGGPRAVASASRESVNRERLKTQPFILNARARGSVEAAIREVCAYRGWILIALAVRTNHVHAVISAAKSSTKVLNDLKAYSTRHLRGQDLWPHSHSPWVDKGSRRFLWTDAHLESASNYVLNGQGGDLPEFV
jgi:REP element-mobilizing transposase RayT